MAGIFPWCTQKGQQDGGMIFSVHCVPEQSSSFSWKEAGCLLEGPFYEVTPDVSMLKLRKAANPCT